MILGRMGISNMRMKVLGLWPNLFWRKTVLVEDGMDRRETEEVGPKEIWAFEIAG